MSNSGRDAIELRSHSGAGVAIIAAEHHGLTLKTINAGDKPEQGWLAMGYRKKVRAPIIMYSASTQLPVVFHTVLIPFRDIPPTVRVTRVSVSAKRSAGTGEALLIERDNTQTVLCFSTNDERVPVHQGWRTDAHVASVQMDKKGKILSCALIDGSMLTGGGAPLLQPHV